MKILGVPGKLWRMNRRAVILGAMALWVTGITAAYLRANRTDTGVSAATQEAISTAQARLVKVGGLPVTCNLTLPIACMAMENEEMAGMEGMDMAGMDHSADDTVTAGIAEYQKFGGWPELKEAIMSNNLQAAYLLAPMVMDLADNGIPVKIVALGHRSGAVVMVRKENPARNFGDLRGKRVAIPSRFAVDHLFVRRLMQEFGVADNEIELVEMPPPDMPSALFAGAVDAYATGEPWGATAELDGYARPLHMTRDFWPDYICCVLAVRQELIDEDPATVQKFVNHVLSAGAWLENDPANRDKAADLASGMNFFGQSARVLRFVLREPPDRVTYRDLQALRADLDELMQLAVTHKVLPRPVAYEKYVDDRFFKNFQRVEINIDQ